MTFAGWDCEHLPQSTQQLQDGCVEHKSSCRSEGLHGKQKPLTYREKARKTYLKMAKKKNKTKVELRSAIGK
jgi:hypothetical protein